MTLMKRHFFPYSSSQQQQIGSPKTPVSVTPISFFSSREEQIGSPVSPVNVAKIRRGMSISPSPIPISADWFQFWVPYTTVVLENLIIPRLLIVLLLF